MVKAMSTFLIWFTKFHLLLHTVVFQKASFHNTGIKTPSNGFKIQSIKHVSYSLQTEPHTSTV